MLGKLAFQLATRAASTSTTRACSALTARNSTMTARLDHDSDRGIKPSSRNGNGMQVTASGTSSGHARLPMGLPGELPHSPHAVNLPPTRPSP